MLAKNKFDIKIYGIHERDFLIRPLKEQLELCDDDICYDDREGSGLSCLYTLDKAMTVPLPDGVTHRLVMPDDMIVCNDFKIILNKIIHAQPDKIIGLWAYRYNRYCQKIKNLKTPYVKSLGGLAGNGVILPVQFIKPMSEWWHSEYRDNFNTYRSETALVKWIKIHQIPVIYTIPSPVQHIGDDYGTHLPYEVIHNRKTLYFREDCLTDVDWDCKDVVFFPNYREYQPIHNEYFKLPKDGLFEENNCFNPRRYII